MAIGSTPATLVNRALQEIAAQASVSGEPPEFDGSAAGLAAGILYPPAITLLLRQEDYEFARNDTALQAAPLVPYPWTYAYLYPTDCAKIRSIKPPQWTQNDPQPIRWTEMDQMIGGVLTRIIGCNIANAVLTYSTLDVEEAQFDPVFEETLVRYLASGLVMSLGGRPDFSTKLLEQAGGLVQQGAGLDS
jgi:hypothetical protein